MAIIIMGGFGGDMDGTAIIVAAFSTGGKISGGHGSDLGPTGGSDTNMGGRAAGMRDQMVNKLGPVTGFWEPEAFGLAMEML